MDGAGVADADRVVDHLAARDVHIRERIYGQPLSAGCFHLGAASGGVVGFHLCQHAVHVVVLFVSVSGQLYPQPTILRRFVWQRGSVFAEFPMLVVILRVVRVVTRDQADGALVAVGEQHLDHQVVDAASKCFVLASKSVMLASKSFVLASKCVLYRSKSFILVSKCFTSFSKCFSLASTYFFRFKMLPFSLRVFHLDLLELVVLLFYLHLHLLCLFRAEHRVGGR